MRYCEHVKLYVMHALLLLHTGYLITGTYNIADLTDQTHVCFQMSVRVGESQPAVAADLL